MSASESVTSRLYAETLAAPGVELRTASTYPFQNPLAAIEAAIDFLTCACGIFAAYLLDAPLYTGREIQYPLREAAGGGRSHRLRGCLPRRAHSWSHARP